MKICQVFHSWMATATSYETLLRYICLSCHFSTTPTGHLLLLLIPELGINRVPCHGVLQRQPHYEHLLGIQQQPDMPRMNIASTPAPGSTIAAMLAEDHAKHSSAQPSKQPDFHHTLSDLFPLPQQAVFCDSTDEDRNPDDLVNIDIAAANHNTMEIYWVPKLLYWWRRNRCIRIQGSSSSATSTLSNRFDIMLCTGRQVQGP
jgi:hypothetical protein